MIRGWLARATVLAALAVLLSFLAPAVSFAQAAPVMTQMRGKI